MNKRWQKCQKLPHQIQLLFISYIVCSDWIEFVSEIARVLKPCGQTTNSSDENDELCSFNTLILLVFRFNVETKMKIVFFLFLYIFTGFDEFEFSVLSNSVDSTYKFYRTQIIYPAAYTIKTNWISNETKKHGIYLLSCLSCVFIVKFLRYSIKVRIIIKRSYR